MMEPAPFRWLEGRLLCLLGSALALGAFFLPTFGSPDGSGWQVMLIGLGFSGQGRDVSLLPFALLAVGYLLGVASLLLLTLWITFRPPDRIVLTCCFAITVAALSIYVVSTVAQIRLPNLDTDCSRRPAPFSLPGVPATFQEAMGADVVLEGR